jgi:hypothetical protein
MDKEGEVMKKHNKVAIGKKLFTTQLPIELIEDLKGFSESVGMPMTVLIEKYLEYGLAKSKRESTLPLNLDREW